MGVLFTERLVAETSNHFFFFFVLARDSEVKF